MATTKQINNLKYVFEPSSVAIIGASRNPSKIGYVMVKNCKDAGFTGKVYPVNPNADNILGIKCYNNITEIKGKLDLVVITIPAKYVTKVLEECGKKNVKAAIIISAGFAEIGNNKDEDLIKQIADKYNIAVIGPNCLGVLNPKVNFDSIFLPMYKLGRPKVGGIACISQSGAIGGCLIDLIARAGLGVSKFISYGNAAVINETDILEYLHKDKCTDIIATYMEGVSNGKKFLNLSKKITKDKPLVVLKAGTSEKGCTAAKSHTGTIAGSSMAYKAAFKQAHIIEAHNIDDLFHLPKIFNQPFCTGDRIAVLTNGGGNGVMAADAIDENKLELAELSTNSKKKLKQVLPSHANINNPLDIIGDATSKRYADSLNVLINDDNIDAILVIVLFQTPTIDSSVTEVIIKAMEERKKPIIVAATGGEYTEIHRRILDSSGVPTYRSQKTAITTLAKFIQYNKYKMNK